MQGLLLSKRRPSFNGITLGHDVRLTTFFFFNFQTRGTDMEPGTF